VLPLIPAVLLLLQAVISAHVELVTIPVTVTDAGGHQVSGLSREDFRLFQDGRPQAIAVFHHGDIPVTLGLVVDRSQSMRPKASALLSAVTALLQPTRPDDELFAVGFNDRVMFPLGKGRPFVHDADAVASALSAIPTEGRTALYDGVAAALLHLELGHSEKKALVLVSDGGDNASRETSSHLLTLARRSQVVIYAIGLLGASPAEEEENPALIERLCRETGGLAYFPRSIDAVLAASTHIARDLREQYLLGFAPDPRSDVRAFRRIEVKVAGAGHDRLHVRARSGYVGAGGESDKP
jgi:Ca-activated chloride channel family protein